MLSLKMVASAGKNMEPTKSAAYIGLTCKQTGIHVESICLLEVRGFTHMTAAVRQLFMLGDFGKQHPLKRNVISFMVKSSAEMAEIRKE